MKWTVREMKESVDLLVHMSVVKEQLNMSTRHSLIIAVTSFTTSSALVETCRAKANLDLTTIFDLWG